MSGWPFGLANESASQGSLSGSDSNILLPDPGLDALVIRLGKSLDRLRQDGDLWTAAPDCRRRWRRDGRGRRTSPASTSSLGFRAPLVGGCDMNAGCHGGDWSGVVRAGDRRGPFGQRPGARAIRVPFTYRHSGLDGRIVLDTAVRLRPEEQARLDEQITEMFEWRQRGTPFNQPCCGSVFKNPAGPELETGSGPRTAGSSSRRPGSGARIGGAQVSPMHANTS